MDYLSFTKKVTKEAGEVTLSYFDKKHTYQIKEGAINFATEADLACEKFVFEKIKKTFPDHSFLSEEMGMVAKKSRYTWVLDPIDGTVNFSRGLPLWGVSLALFEDTLPIAGTIYFPVFDELYFAQKGKGAFRGKKKIRVSSCDKLPRSLVIVEFGYPENRRKLTLPVAGFMKDFPAMFLTPLSTVYDMVSLASGKVEGFIEEHPLIWDIAAGAIIVEEAGGKVTDFSGNKLVYELKKDKYYDVLASNGKLHDEILKYLKRG